MHCSNREGQLLDKALAKQIARREAQLDSFLQRNVSVIVRTSTPNPDTTCENNFPSQFFSTPTTIFVPHVPEDNNLSLRNLLHNLSHQPEDQPLLPPRHPTLLLPGEEIAPTVPWTPPRQESFDSQLESGPREPLLCCDWYLYVILQIRPYLVISDLPVVAELLNSDL